MSRRTVTIGPYEIGGDNKVPVIAEIGINHNGKKKGEHSVFRFIDAARVSGADFVKFQTRDVDVVYPAADLEKKRQVPPFNGIMANAIERGVLPEEAIKRLESSGYEDTTNGDLKRALEFTPDEYRQIDEYCRKDPSILWFSSPWDAGKSMDLLESLNVPCYKIASACLTDQDLLRRIKKTGQPVILSTGMSTMDQVDEAVRLLDRDNLILMHTVSTYPTLDKHLNLRVIKTLQEKYPDVPIGYSGHEQDLMPSVMAVAYGASIVERHITLHRQLWGSDQQASIIPRELSQLVDMIRQAEIIRGDGVKSVLPEEEVVRAKLRRYQ